MPLIVMSFFTPVARSWARVACSLLSNGSSYSAIMKSFARSLHRPTSSRGACPTNFSRTGAPASVPNYSDGLGPLTPTRDPIVIDRGAQVADDAEAIRLPRRRVPVATFVNNHHAGFAPETVRQLVARLAAASA